MVATKSPTTPVLRTLRTEVPHWPTRGKRQPWRRQTHAINEVARAWSPSSFDDQYQGCSRMMEKELEELNRTEFANPDYAEGWRGAVMVEESMGPCHPRRLRQEQAVAVLAYTAERGLYKQFNTAVREGGRSREHYLQSFPRLQDLPPRLPRHQRHPLHSPAPPDRPLRPVNLRLPPEEGSTESFGQDTFFVVGCCYSVPIKNFSFYPGEDEVLIPPYEVFKVTTSTRDRDGNFIHLHAQTALSNYTASLWKGKEKRCKPVHVSSAQVRGEPSPIPWPAPCWHPPAVINSRFPPQAGAVPGNPPHRSGAGLWLAPQPPVPRFGSAGGTDWGLPTEQHRALSQLWRHRGHLAFLRTPRGAPAPPAHRWTPGSLNAL
uniref:NAD(P)(+)--arginine ADP-ribosyltransferase n=1 Tax=Anas platyrhynchos TaxID=8839 RepID=A0A8B9SLW2_ANAPL